VKIFQPTIRKIFTDSQVQYMWRAIKTYQPQIFYRNQISNLKLNLVPARRQTVLSGDNSCTCCSFNLC